MSPYQPVPDLTAGRPKYDREHDLFQWLREHCEWIESQPLDKQPVYKAYAEWEKAKYGIRPSDRTIDRSVTTLGFILDGSCVFGISLRGKDAVREVQPQPNEGMRVASPSPSLIAANIGVVKPEPIPEVGLRRSRANAKGQCCIKMLRVSGGSVKTIRR